MQREEFDKEVEWFVYRMKEILAAKGHDYASNDDRFSNFRLCEQMSIPAWKGILIRLSDKVSRLFSFAASDEFKVKDESFEDTCIDLANYAVLLLNAYKEHKGVNTHVRRGQGENMIVPSPDPAFFLDITNSIVKDDEIPF